MRPFGAPAASQRLPPATNSPAGADQGLANRRDAPLHATLSLLRRRRWRPWQRPHTPRTPSRLSLFASHLSNYTEFCSCPLYFCPQVFFDVEIDGKPAGRIVMGLFGKVRHPPRFGAAAALMRL